jgi:hypothetical protein
MVLFVAAALTAALPVSHAEDPKRKTENVLFVMLDGLRWQEVFSGADEALLNTKRGGVANVPGIRKRFWRDRPAERRAALLPFLWGTVAKDGQLFGNHRTKSVGKVTNGKNFSYPGYNEILCGFADPKIDSNNKVRNRNVTVLEWLHNKPGFKGKVTAFTSWDVFPYIINDERSGILVNAGSAPLTGIAQTDEVRLLNRLIVETPLEAADTRPDSLTYHAVRIYLKAKKPRVLFLSFDETDAQGHAGRYDRLLTSAHKNDFYVRELWETVQTMPEYRGKTSLIVSTDHGRGDPPSAWKDHGARTKGSEFFWVGILGPDTPALGERKNIDPVGQDQVAATLAALLGFDYRADVPRAGKVLPDAVER